MCSESTFIQVHTNWQKYFNAHKWAPTLTPKLIPFRNIYPTASRFTHRSGLLLGTGLRNRFTHLKKIFATNTVAHKLQLRHESSNIKQRDIPITSYTLDIEDSCDALGSINAVIGWWHGANMPRRLNTTIWHDLIGHPYKGESSLIFQPAVDIVGRGEPCPIKEKCTE